MRITLTTLFCCFCLFCFSQDFKQPAPTASAKRLKAASIRADLEKASLVNKVEFENIGPAVMSGRVVDLAVNPKNPTEFYVAYASGGLWKTKNNGVSFIPIFDNEDVLTTGAVAVNWSSGTIWLGTGEVNSSRSSYAGTGIYKSTDDGETWTHLGLAESHHIGRIVLHPDDPNTAWVAVLGHLYSPNKDRGVYKTIDGGKTWNQTLFENENAGAIDLVMHPDNPNELYAAIWERQRRAWNFWEAGSGTGIHKSIDGGLTWTRISTPKSGFPTGENIGRIGLDIYSKNGNTILFAVVDNQNRRPEEEKEDTDELTKADLRKISVQDFLKLEDDQLEAFLRDNGFPKKHTAKSVKLQIEDGEIEPMTLVEYLEDANSLLFDTPVVGLEVYRSDDSGKKWTKTHDGFMDDIYYSYGYYFGQIRVNPINPRKVYIMGVPVLRSNDGGATFESINEDNVHVDHHALWVNPDQKGHLILGNDGGVNISYDEGDTWVKCNTPAVGQFYTVAVDMDEPYNVYGGLQDNGVWTGPSTYEASYGWHNSGQYPYKSIMGGDGMQIAIDSRDNNTVYTGYQFGNYFRINKQTGDSEYITPKHELGDRPYRWNWQTPIHLSKHNQDILYMGSNHFHRSFDQGKTFETLSKKDLTKGGKKGDVAFGTLTTISESPKRFGLLYVGTDDGFVHLSKDGGYSWERISDQLPQDMWVTRVQASAHEEGRVLVALNGYRYDHFNVYLYISDNFGKTWIKVGNGLPAEPVNVFKEDPVNPDLLYVGTDHGLYISLDRGKTFMQMNGGLAGASVHDLVVHPRDQELVIGTHGRSIYKTDIQYVQALVDSITSQAFYAWDLESIRHRNWGNAWSQWFPAEDPEVTMPMFTQSPGNVSVTLKMGSLEVHRFSTSVDAGLNFPIYNLAISESQAKILEKEVNKEKEEKDQIKIKAADNGKYYLAKGDYEVILELNGKKVTKTLKLE